ncbi:MAG TPA: sodium:solute symporter [Nitrososphaerales archaeon]|nr:sodium:solute symporter [Nitrososphaerales archaeon]
MALTLSSEAYPIFIVLFAIFVALGFAGSRWRKGDLNQLWDWALAGRRLGTWLAFFLIGADLYTAYTFVAVPSGVYASGPLYFFAVPYVAITFGVALAFAPRLWTRAREKGYVTGSDFVKDQFNSVVLAILVAITGIVALLPYIALQIVGMQAVLTTMFETSGISTANIAGLPLTSGEMALLIAFIILAAFTYTSGLRGATLTAVYKDILIWVSVIAVIGAALIALGGNFGTAFADAGAKYSSLSTTLEPGYATLVLGSALALYLYPHAINGVLSSESAHKLRVSTSLLCLYGIGLAFLALFGVLVYAFPSALGFVKGFAGTTGGIYVVPALIIATLPGWLQGVALLGVFIGGLVPAAIMAIAQANLLTRNIIKEFKPNLSSKGETTIAKWASAAFKFIALGFVFIVPATYAIQLQLLGGVLILQLLPSVFLGLYTTWLKKEALAVGLLGGIGLGIYLALEANHFGPLTTSLFSTPLGPLYIAVIALGFNLLLTLVLSAVIPKRVPQIKPIPAPS